jgi:hypothetical protein
MISRTADGGDRWSTPVPKRESNAYFQGHQIAVGPDGTLDNVTANLFTGRVSSPTIRASTWARPAAVGRRAARGRRGRERAGEEFRHRASRDDPDQSGAA